MASADFSTASAALSDDTVPHYPVIHTDEASGTPEEISPGKRPATFLAHPPRLRDGSLMDIGLRHAEPARPDRPASYAQHNKPERPRCAMCS